MLQPFHNFHIELSFKVAHHVKSVVVAMRAKCTFLRHLRDVVHPRQPLLGAVLHVQRQGQQPADGQGADHSRGAIGEFVPDADGALLLRRDRAHRAVAKRRPLSKLAFTTCDLRHTRDLGSDGEPPSPASRL